MGPWLLLGIALAAEIPAGEGIDASLGVQVGPGGLDEISALVPALLPTDALAIEDVSDTIGVPAICVGGSYELSNIAADVVINDVQITPLQGELELYVDLTVALNDPNNPFTMLIDAICLIDENCSGWIDPFDLWVTAPLTLDVVGTPGGRTLDATVGNLDIQHNLTANELQTDCLLNDIEEVINLFGLSIFDLVVNLFGSQIEAAIEPALDELLAETNFSGELELLEGSFVSYGLEPSATYHSPAGLEIHFASMFSADQAECIADDDPGSSFATLSGVPLPQDNPPGTHVAAHVSMDMLNQVLYAAWRGGALCMDIGGADSGLDLPIPLDTGLLSLIGGSEYDALFPEPKPIEIVLAPHAAPVGVANGPDDINLALNDLELIFMGELDGRMARALGVEVDAEIGANVPFDETTGELSVELVVDDANIQAVLSGDPMVDGIEERVREQFPAVMGTILDSLLPSLVGDSLAFTLPTFEGLGLVTLDLEASGAGQDWLGAATTIGQPVYADPYATGCGCDGGTGSTSTDCGGCATTGAPRVLPVSWLLALALVRRRQR